MTRRVPLISAIAVVVAAAMPTAQSAPTEDSLKLTHRTLMSAITSGNPAMLEPVLHRNGTGFYRDSQMIVQFGSGYSAKDAIPSVLEDLGRFTSTAYETVYRMVGTTGVVCMATNFLPKKGEAAQPRYVRSTWTYAFVDGAWRLLSWHTSDIPLKK